MHILYQAPFGKSAKLLAQKVGVPAIRSTPNLRTTRALQATSEAVVSWGARTAPQSLNGAINVSKLSQLQAWEDSSLTTLQYSLSPKQGWLGRTGQGHGGSDFSPTLSIQPRYWTKPVTNVSREWRVHVFRTPNSKRGNPTSYKVLRVGFKVNEDESLNQEACGISIRSRQYGWKIAYLSQSNFRRRISSDLDLAARWAIAVIGWDFGAIDVLETEDGKFVLLEANSCPGLLDEKTQIAYADAVKEHIDDGVQ